MRRPFLFLAIPLILGVVFAYFINVNTYIITFLLLISLLFHMIKLKLNKSYTLNLLFSCFLLGILILNLRGNSSMLINTVNIPMEIRGNVVDIKSIGKEESRYILLVNNIVSEDFNINTYEKIILKIIGEEKLELGDEIIFNGVLKEPLPNTNPKLFNYKLNLLTKNIFTTATIKEYSIIKVSKPEPNTSMKIKMAFIKRVENRLDYSLSNRNSNIMKSIVLGQYSYLDEEDLVKFRDLGLAHILAVSGLHIGIIAGILVYVFGYLGLDRRINLTLTIIILWIYAYIIGNPASVIRANIMFTMLLLAELLREPYDSINILCFSAFLMIIKNPYIVFDIGFQLSYMATFSLLYLGPKLNNIFPKSIGGILAVQIGLLPIQAYYFNNIPILSIVANLFLIPLFSIALVLSMFLIFLPSFLLPIIKVLGIIINTLLNVEFLGIEILSSFPRLVLKLHSPNVFEILSYYLILIMVLNNIKVRKVNPYIIKSIVLYTMLILILNLSLLNLDESISIKFIDVGQGDSVLIQTQNGNYLIDTGGNIFGNFDIGKNILCPYLEKEGIFKLKGVFISHFDVDHCKGLIYLIDNMEIEKIYIGYTRPGNIYYDEILRKAKAREVPIVLLKTKDSFKLDSNTSITVHGPDEKILDTQNSDNDLSMVLMLNYLDQNILFTGDIEKIGEDILIGNMEEKIDFLKVPHHGSKTSSSKELLDSIKPNIGFISVGRNNSFGHPHGEVLERYYNKNIEVFRTDELGLINLVLNEENYNIIPFMKEDLDIIYMWKYYGLHIFKFILYNIISYLLIRRFTILDKEMKKIEL